MYIVQNCNYNNLGLFTRLVGFVEIYVNILKKNNLKITHQRLEILKYLDLNLNHPTAEEIYTYLKKTNPGLSRTTVYNTLEKLSDVNIIQRLTICATEHRYDFNMDFHHHFICKNCGKIHDIDFQCPKITEIKKHVTSQGHQVDEVHGYFKGICKDCLQKK